MPRLYRGDQYTTVGLVLVYLAFNYPNTKIFYNKRVFASVYDVLKRTITIHAFMYTGLHCSNNTGLL